MNTAKHIAIVDHVNNIISDKREVEIVCGGKEDNSGEITKSPEDVAADLESVIMSALEEAVSVVGERVIIDLDQIEEALNMDESNV